jgi:hypothetical protein
MKVVHIYAGPDDLAKFRECVASFRESGLIRGQVSGDDVCGAWNQLAEILAAAQVGCRINLRRALPEVRNSRENVFSRGTVGMAPVTVAHSVDQIAAQPYQLAVFPFEIQRDRSYFETLSNFGCMVIVVTIIRVDAKKSG